MKKLSFLVVFFILATACGHKDKAFLPDRLLTEQEMIDVMTDVQIIEADINYQKTQERDNTPNDTMEKLPKDYVAISREYYGQLFEHYGITDSIFAQNLAYYTERPADLERIMDSVLQRLVRMQSNSSTQQPANH